MNYDPARLCSLKSALLIIDMQNDFVADGGAFEQAGFDVTPYQMLEPTIYNMMEAARESQLPVVFVWMEHNDENDGQAAWKERRVAKKHPFSCREGSWGSEPYGRLTPRADEKVFKKHRYSAFSNNSLEHYLQSLQIETLVLCGINTNVCVESTARNAHEKDFHIVLVKDATTCAYRDVYEASLKNIERHIGALTTSEEWIGLMRDFQAEKS
ncbi:isochorismatase hydrolase [Alkalihalobacillus alcalophilus ATCC 27647 = CGMCC 1.3604]|uniref:Isochorismatase n=1 Tax=Alkalihalobacillus alcalophilus ATCC 27647 = CGMCC 1.3604 TaxID=1218173 RepID=A0A094YR75_ALKAL|nr:cysteine hydrolase [Alkalihalobacillus alcalophilus]KGA95977.1 isochorismatase [Alkalihalobacillus alcalophilus ATCC 27647 = CGMCC 1.3604]MED1562076.1 cysteine hydrolase [Alkalihalobacillus alcalophilus]THG88287.1 isochorismatase hydrolase [Alkalihalobacillus alcalophilus ATCC 27647 = CGMCC 1.3604]